ncbi:MAG: hypothetical protein OXF62_10915 [Caldilineaceae bacterium]|nr:hypothetical protein [Caldilineaceae bacterium]MCY4091319.1 hypothetical protein [Caldilineaceae bacterium]MCY4116592.1 hypothetical protein [Caldilineaceae bacterium]MDE0069078.1 hypothetical protein [Caldilineaceae bacterium]MDE0183673.1 hypothetical protein [Caldilineaceae bacterium]
MRVVFPDGSEYPVPLVDLPFGSDVYLIGCPAEYEAFPQPTITTGILSQLCSWETKRRPPC